MGLIKFFIDPENIMTETASVSMSVCVCVFCLYVLSACVCACKQSPGCESVTALSPSANCGEVPVSEPLLQAQHAQTYGSTDGPDLGREN